MTSLLVSPRNLTEALAAFRGGADILDVKNPDEGSLGANFPWIITEIRKSIPENLPLSASVGDVPDLPGTVALASLGALRAGANIIKIGLKGPKTETGAIYLLRKVVKAVREASNSAKVVACGYGDYQRAETIDPLLIPEVASESGANIAMLDTAIKDGKPLTNFLTVDELGDFIEKAHSLDARAALAGSLGREEISKLKLLRPDVIGIRGAVCENGDRRRGSISEASVRKMKKFLED